MMKPRNLGALLALGALTALPACSMFGGGSSSSSGSSSQYGQNTTPPPPASYGTASAATGASGTVAPVSPGMIRKVQSALQQNGDYKGRVDGVWGPMTENGVRSWQQAHNLSTSGEIDTATLQSMNISSGNQANNESGQASTNSAAAQPAGNQPAGNQNYSTGPSRAPGSTYSSNNGQVPANNANPAGQGAPSTPGDNNSSTSGAAAPTSTGGNANH